LASKHAFWYYENNFQFFFLPEVIDSGHPPFFGMSLAALWKIFGQELWVGHMAMLPFLLGIIFLSAKIANYFFEEMGYVILLLLIAVDPFILGQAVLVSPDVPVLFAFLLGIYAILRKHSAWKVVAALLLAAVSMRGMMLVVVLFLFDLCRDLDFKTISIKVFLQKVAPYIPSGLFGITFLVAHYQYAGWIGYHENSSWAPAFEKVGLMGALRNIGLIIWRLLDFGRISICLLLSIGGGFYFYKNGLKNQKAKELLLLLTLAVLILTPSLIIHKHLTAHRYLLPITTLMNFAVVFVLLQTIKKQLWQKALAAILVLSLFTGNAWVYPQKIAQGWDSTLGHWPYYDLRQQMLDYIAKEKIPLEKIGTDFPNNTDLKYIDLKPGIGTFPLFDLKTQDYILYSNIYNDFSDEAIDELSQNWKVKKQLERFNICVILYERERR
jgi:hypothetical protein